ncbi:MAG TPA: PilN domain-containing protein [Novimethylophilus sp.]|jgi:type IV pilus assembly protein PilN|uniref:PilN domain-containing protein n=1 Tax=Novimethylophilus sp. TaxID=2137426 RepID=UPI002F3EC198
MRIRINLLPHRQIKRAEQQRQFGLMAAAVLTLGLAIIFTGYTYIGTDVAAQASRNQRLKDAIAKLDNEIKEIDGLKAKIGELKDRIQAVESLQNNRSRAVVMLDEIARQIPEAVALKSLKQTGDLITMEGVADTNARVAVLVKNLSNSNILYSPQLIQIVSSNQNNQKMSAFTMTVKLKSATPDSDAMKQLQQKRG